MSLTWYAVNNSATAEDIDVLGALGVELLPRSSSPVEVYRDPDTGRVLARVGAVTVHRDGRVSVRPRSDAPEAAVTVLIRTASECIARELHLRDAWAYTRTRGGKCGFWRARISVQLPAGASLFAGEAAVLGQPINLVMEAPLSTPVHELV